MARYIDADDKKFPTRCDSYGDFERGWNACLKTIFQLPTADVVPRAELDAMRGAANSYKMHYEKAKQEAYRLTVELEEERARRLAEVEYWRGEARKWKQEKYDFFQGLELCKITEDRVARAMLKEIENLMKRHIFPVVREGIVEIEREPFLIIDPKDWVAFKGRFTGYPVPMNIQNIGIDLSGSSRTPTPTDEKIGGGSDEKFS